MTDNGRLSAYIHDGYTVAGYIQEVPRLYPAVRFVFRPVLSQNRAVVFREIQRANDPRKEETIAAEIIKAQIQSWDILDENGETLPIETSKILRLQPRLSNRMFRMIVGDEATDEDPAVTEAERNESSERELTAAMAGETPEATEAADAKNSGTG